MATPANSHRTPLASARARSFAALVLATSLLAPVAVLSQQPSQQPGQAPSGAPPHDWLVEVAANEANTIQHTGSYLRYRMHLHDAKGDRVRDVLESKDGTVARLIARDGRPLTSEEDLAERNRLQSMLDSPSAFQKHVHSDDSGKKLAVDMIHLMPDAMIYTYTPGQPQLPLQASPNQVVLDFAPNPHWSPPDTASEALRGMRGRLWIDPTTRHILRAEGNIFQPVNFGWGMVAHIYPGGSLALNQVRVNPDRWIFSSFVEQIKLRALMVKTLNVDSSVEASHFQTLPHPISYTEAIHLLLNTPLPTDLAANQSPR